ncbi:hypothetical protein LJC10_05140 [Selenomonadales bacterium OttesenSCG-928-I06]|nr:hypothetical protein [Selenomonadales bacterium OttesenSCG-928-I06]
MKKKLTERCIDINTPYCPCLLAETNNCIFCNHLNGGAVCDCNWGGVCILYEKLWKKNKIAKTKQLDFDLPTPIRTELETEFKIKEQINANTYVIEFGVSEILAESLNKIGSFVFLRRPSDKEFYHFPVGVMSVDDTKITVAIEAIGPKSTRIFSDENRSLFVRGPYFNGVFGQPWIENLTNSKVVLLAGGIGQAPALPILKKLIENENEVKAILAPGKVGSIFIKEEFESSEIEVIEVDSLRKYGLKLMKDCIETNNFAPELIVSAGPDEQHFSIITAMKDINVNIPMAATNNSTMCCGEGICGSCQRKTKDNKTVRCCKDQIDFRDLDLSHLNQD